MEKHQLSQAEWLQVKSWFIQLLEVAPSQIDSRIEALTQKSHLQHALRELMAANQSISGLTLTPEQSAMAVVAKQDRLQVGDSFSKFKILRLLGSGGMGEVYLAERQEQVTQQVALKVLSRHSMNHQTRHRFETERQILAGLEHPNIARLIDAGIEGGVPFYAMEYIDGQALDVYCAEQQLGLKPRLKLFLQVCEAVAHAHKNLVVHRDLKPSNILVNEAGNAKLLDFGIAKPLKVLPGTEDVLQTIEGLAALTPAYSAPEQINGEAITVACDVYLLGLLLYKLVTGEDAFDLADKTWGEIESIINDRLPTNPSRMLSQLSDRQSSVRASQVNSDLDAIIFHALKKAPTERYQSVAEMAEDLRRWLRHEPLQIKKDQVIYRFKKHLRRHWFPITALTSLVLVLLGSAWMFRQQSMIISQERDVALIEKQTAEQVTAFLVETFKSADPLQTNGSELLASDVLKQAAIDLDSQNLNADISNRLRVIIAEVYFNLGDVNNAEAQLKALDQLNDPQLSTQKLMVESDILLSKTGDENAQTVKDLMQNLINNGAINGQEKMAAYHRLARALNSLDQFQEAKEIMGLLMSLSAELNGSESIEHSQWLSKIAGLNSFLEDGQANLELLMQAAKIQESQLGEKHLITANTYYEISGLYLTILFDSQQALDHALKAHEIYVHVYGEHYPKRIQVENLLGSAYSNLKLNEQALSHFQTGIDLEKNHYTNDPHRLATLGYNKANIYLYNLNDYQQALESYQEVLQVVGETKGKDSQRYMFMRLNYIRALILDGQLELAKGLLDETHDFYSTHKKNSYGEKGFSLGRTKAMLGMWHMKQSQWCEAKQWLTDSLFHLDVGGVDNDQYVDAVNHLKAVENHLGNEEACEIE